MGKLMLEHPLVQFYLVYVGALLVAFLCARLFNSPASRGGSPAEPAEERCREEADRSASR
jgi:hypothetical protein